MRWTRPSPEVATHTSRSMIVTARGFGPTPSTVAATSRRPPSTRVTLLPEASATQTAPAPTATSTGSPPTFGTLRTSPVASTICETEPSPEFATQIARLDVGQALGAARRRRTRR